jgi:hypothetical protein
MRCSCKHDLKLHKYDKDLDGRYDCMVKGCDCEAFENQDNFEDVKELDF